MSHLRLTLAAAGPLLLCSQMALAQTTMPPPQGDLGGKQPMSSTATNTDAANAHTPWSPSLPAPAVDDEAPPSAFLAAAQKAIAANRTGEAQEALERAESRALDRAVRPSRANQPSRQPLVAQIAQARQVLGNGDRQGALNIIAAALADPQAKEAD